MKPVAFPGDSLDAVRSFPDDPWREAGFQIDRIQRGLDPDHRKPMATVGPGVREIRIGDVHGAFRVISIATFPAAVYVLHAFQKTSQATARHDIDLAIARLKELTQR